MLDQLTLENIYSNADKEYLISQIVTRDMGHTLEELFDENLQSMYVSISLISALLDNPAIPLQALIEMRLKKLKHTTIDQKCAMVDLIYKAIRVLEDADIVTIKTNNLVICEVSLTHEEQREIDNKGFPYPLIEPPKQVVNRYDTGYHNNVSRSIISKIPQPVDRDYNLDFINIVNAVPYAVTLDTAMKYPLPLPDNINNFSYKARGVFETNQANFLARFDEFSQYIPGTQELYFTHVYEHRGRYSPRGYHFNPQGTSWDKSLYISPRTEELSESGKKYLLREVAKLYDSSVDKEIFQPAYIIKTSFPDEPELYDTLDRNTSYAYTNPDGIISRALVSIDATSSGIQLASVLTRDIKAMRLSNVISTTDHRSDAYTTIFDRLVKAEPRIAEKNITRKEVKNAVMTTFYGSTAEPKKIFGKRFLPAYYGILKDAAPHVFALNSICQKLGETPKSVYEFSMPDGFTVYKEFEEDEVLALPTRFGTVNVRVPHVPEVPSVSTKALSTLLVHPVEAFVDRELTMRHSEEIRTAALLQLSSLTHPKTPKNADPLIYRNLIQLWRETGILSCRIFLHFHLTEVLLTKEEITEISDFAKRIVNLRPTEVYSIYDCFRVHPNYAEEVKNTYAQIMSEIYESNLLSYLLPKFGYEDDVTLEDVDLDVSQQIKNSVYCIC